MPFSVSAALIVGFPNAVQSDPTSAKFISIFMPNDTRQWIHLWGTSCVNRVRDGRISANAVSCVAATNGTSLPLADYSGMATRKYGLNTFASASSNGNSLHSYLRTTGAAHLDNYIRDTYTLFSDTLALGTLVNITANLAVNAIITRALVDPLGVNYCNIGLCATGGVNTSINDSAFGYGSISMGGNTTLKQINYTSSKTLSVAIGTPFDVIYKMSLGSVSNTATSFAVDASHTATIGFNLPTGARLTSVLGYGATTATTSVPEPSSISIFLLALLFFGVRLIGANFKHKA